MFTAETKRLGFWTMSCASCMYSANVVPPFSLRKCGKTSSRTTRNISAASFCLKFFQRRGSFGPVNRPLNGFLVRSARRSPVVSITSSRRANMRNEICSMTVSGLVMPPVQNSVQSLSMSLFCCVVRVLMMLGSREGDRWASRAWVRRR
jgi:hypothetical protein